MRSRFAAGLLSAAGTDHRLARAMDASGAAGAPSSRDLQTLQPRASRRRRRVRRRRRAGTTTAQCRRGCGGASPCPPRWHDDPDRRRAAWITTMAASPKSFAIGRDQCGAGSWRSTPRCRPPSELKRSRFGGAHRTGTRRRTSSPVMIRKPLQLARIEGAARDFQPFQALVDIGIERRPQRAEIDRARHVMKFRRRTRYSVGQRSASSMRAISAGVGGIRTRLRNCAMRSSSYVSNLRIEVAAVVEVERHGIDIAARPGRDRQPREDAEAPPPCAPSHARPTSDPGTDRSRRKSAAARMIRWRRGFRRGRRAIPPAQRRGTLGQTVLASPGGCLVRRLLVALQSKATTYLHRRRRLCDACARRRIAAGCHVG